MSEEFKVLSDKEHLLLRPTMFVGSVSCEPQSGIYNYEYQSKTIVPALIKIVEEIFQNSLDEYIRTKGVFATNISINIEETLEGTEVCVSDDGRGIPIEKINGVYRPVLAWTELRAGSNFDDSKRIGVGSHGIGGSACNILSKSFIGQTCDGKNQITVMCSDNMSVVNHKLSTSNNRGTRVNFIPDLARFGLTEFTQDHIDVIQDRINNLAILYPKIQFTFNGERVMFRNVKHVAKRFHATAVAYEQPNISLVFAPAGDDEEFRCLSYVNGIYIKNGGSHVDFVMNKVIESLRVHIKRKFKIEVLPNGIRQHLLFASWVSGFPALRFDSQSKERVTNSVGEVSSVFKDIDFDKISKQILDTPEIIDPCIASILYKKEMAEKLALAKKQKAVTKTRIVNHISATDPDPENRMLIVAEGLSALGNLINVRNPKTTGGYALKGKPLNVRGMKPMEILKNKEIFELLTIIGLEFGKPATNLNYGKIVCFSDADVDGSHIFGLLLNLFAMWPDLFEELRIYRMISPLYLCKKGNKVKLFYSESEFAAVDTSGWDISRYKGLGSMPEEIYSDCINNPRLIQVVCANDLEYLDMAFGDDASLRKKWMIET